MLSLIVTGCGSLEQGRIEPQFDSTAFLEPPVEAYANQSEIATVSIPSRDLVDLTRRFNDNPEVPSIANNELVGYETGDSAIFWYKNHDNDDNVQIKATLRYRSDQLNLWFQDGVEVESEVLNQAATRIEEEIFPTSRKLFGIEWQPGIDGDSRVNILHLDELGGGVIGYFSQADEFVTEVNPFSNERELIYLSNERAPVASDMYFHVIAHEMQHMIHWNVDPNEEVWIGEGLSELSSFLNGFSESDYVERFMDQPDVQLTDFQYEGPEADAHYGASFLFFEYFLEQYGEEAIRALVSQISNGIASIEQALLDIDPGKDFNDLFARWLAANYLDYRLDNNDGYSYENLELPEIYTPSTIKRFPASGEAIVHQYGADYLRISNNQPVTFVFTGTRQVGMFGAEPHSGQYAWSSFPSDNSDLTLTREFDLSGVESPSLNFWTWYELEDGWDYGYVTVSTDGGETWTPLETSSSTNSNPQGNSFGPSLTGISGVGDTPVWTRETADLSPFAGQNIHLRFEVINDDTVHGQGFVIDDVEIPELSFKDDFENKNGTWISEGFVRHTNVLPQQFVLQSIMLSDDGFEVRQLDLDSSQRGEWILPLGQEFSEAVIIIAGITPVTSRPAGYYYEITE
jgi:immune inhibitor A